jgi:uncharacterized membrane protein YdjX (TVP38/TMEM64 family)
MTDTIVSAPVDRRRATWAPILVRVGLLLGILGLLAAGARLLGPWSPDRLQGLLAAAGPFTPVAFVGLFVVLNTAGVPAPLLGAAGGLTLGPIVGALATLVGMTVAASVQLLLGRRLARSAMAAVRLPGAHRLQQTLQGRGWLAVVALRLAPGPFSEVNLAAGLTPLRVRSMAIGTLIGGAPKALAWTALGLGVTHLPVPPAPVIAVVVGVGLTLGILWLRRRGQPRAAGRREPAPPLEPSPTADSPALERTVDNHGRGEESC